MISYGINYYDSSRVDSIIVSLNEFKPQDFHKLLEWLEKAKQYNGFLY